MGRGDDARKGWEIERAARRVTASDHDWIAPQGERRSPDLTKTEILIAGLAYGAGFGVVGGAIVVAYLVASS